MLSPDDFIISRKRKKYRFALFSNSPICFELEEWNKRPVDIIELGAGTGGFSLELAARHPEKTVVAVDVKADRLQRGAYEAMTRGLTNIFFVRARADQLLELFDQATIESLWLTFPDPFPKTRSAKHRLTHAKYLSIYQSLLRQNGSLYLKHDSREFFEWSLEQLVEQRWKIEELSFDLHESNLSDIYKIKTVYETRWLNEGKPTNFVSAKNA